METKTLFVLSILISLLIFGCSSQTPTKPVVPSPEPLPPSLNTSESNASSPQPTAPRPESIPASINSSGIEVPVQSNLTPAQEPKLNDTNESLKIASWNLQIFGKKKAENVTLMAFYNQTMRQYDIIFIEEIRDSSGTAFPELCSLMDEYRCLNSSRAGRSQSKEQYGIIYKNAEVIGMKDYNPDTQDRWERPPFQVTFKRGGYHFTALVIHTKPDDAPKEVLALDALASNISGNVVVLGDLNADCSYYTNKTDFKGGWFWAIKTGTDTTTSNTSCTYDRMIFNSDMKNEYVSSGVFSNGINSSVSDHYLIWSEIRTKEME